MDWAVQDKRAISWVLDVAVIVAGLIIALAAFFEFLSEGRPETHWVVAILVGAPITALMSRYPLLLNNSTTGIEVGFESAILVFLACYSDGSGALVAWVVGQVVSQATTSKRLDIKIFNIGLGVVAGAAALVVMRRISDLNNTSPRELMAVALGCAVFFFVDYVLSAISIALEEHGSFTQEMRQSTAWLAMGVFVAIDSLGYLAALVERRLPLWTAGLFAVPLVTIVVATRALARGSEHRRRLETLFDAAAEAQVVHSRLALEDLLRRKARAVVGQVKADLRADDPLPKEIGAQVRTGAGAQWLVAPALNRARASVEADQKALEALATLGEEAYSRIALTEEMGHLARHDALTELPNRTLFLDRVQQAVVRSRRSGDALAVLFLDLDGFKGVNDRFGHAEGDALLKTFAQRLVACLREEDSVARLGGDEFAVLLEGVDGVPEVDALCQRLLAALRTEITIVGHDVVVGASIGVAMAAPDDDASGLLRNADMAMYRAKALGKDRFFVYQPSLREENVRRLELVEALRQGIADQLVVHYQPIIDLVTGRIEGMEALVRWQREDGLVSPDVFIGAAEESGLIGALGAQVLAQLVADAPVLQAAAGHPLTLGCNMSAHQLRDPAFLPLVGDAVAALGDNQLVLEMTETVVVNNDNDTDTALRTLKALGAQLAIDDFGIGFSSIGYLQHLPVDILKIDRSFIRDIDTSPRAAALVEAILVMGKALDLKVVAEGIERGAQVDRLRAAGCATGQGFLFGRPQPVTQMVRLLHTGPLHGDLDLIRAASA